MKITKTKFNDLTIFKSQNFLDNRGIFRELAYKKKVSFYNFI